MSSRNPSPVWRAAGAWLLAPAVRASLSALGLRGTLRWVEACTPEPRGPSAGAGAVTATRRAVDRAFAMQLMPGSCLPRAVVQYGLHRLAGERVRLVVGVHRRGREGLSAHAWVEPAHALQGPRRHGQADFWPLLVRPAEAA